MIDSTLNPGSIPPPPRRLLVRWGVPIVLLAAVAALVAFVARGSLRSRLEVEAVPVALRAVEVDAPATDDESAAVIAPGWVEADPSTHRVVALADGVVQEVLVVEGDTVAVDQPIATLVADEARIALARADAEVARRAALRSEFVAQLSAARSNREHLVDLRRREAVARAEVDRGSAAAEAARAAAEADDAERRELADEVARLEALAARGGASEGSVARAKLRLATAAATVEASRATAQAVAAAVAAARAEHAAAVRDLELLIAENLAVESAEAGLAAAEAEYRLALATRDDAALRLERMTVRSPIDGVVIERLVVPGSRLGGTGAAVAELYDPRHLQVRVDVPLADAARVGVGQPAEVVLDLLPDRVFRGEVSRFVHRADLAKNTVPVKVRLLDPDPRLKPDMLARVRLLPMAQQGQDLRGQRTRVFVPEIALRADTGGSAEATAVVVDADGAGTTEARRLDLGPARIDGWREVIDGLRAGEWVVLGEPPPDGTSVRVVEASRELSARRASP